MSLPLSYQLNGKTNVYTIYVTEILFYTYQCGCLTSLPLPCYGCIQSPILDSQFQFLSSLNDQIWSLLFSAFPHSKLKLI